MSELTDRIAELEEEKQEYIFTITSEEIGQKSVSWGELFDIQADAEARWNNTEQGQELKALLWADGNEKTMSLYYALKAALQELETLDSMGLVTPLTEEEVRPDPEVMYTVYAAIHQTEEGE